MYGVCVCVIGKIGGSGGYIIKYTGCVCVRVYVYVGTVKRNKSYGTTWYTAGAFSPDESGGGGEGGVVRERSLSRRERTRDVAPV